MKILKNHKTTFFKNVMTLLSGNALSQIISFAILPILTRLFSEELFGVFILYSSTMMLLRPIGTMSYHLSLLLPKNDEDAVNLLCFNFLLVIAISLLLLFVVFMCKDSIYELLNITSLGGYIYYFPLSMFFVASIEILEHWNNRRGKFINISSGLLSKSIALNSGQLFVGFSSFKKIGLIPGLIFGQIINGIFLFIASFRSVQELWESVSFKNMFKMAKIYKDIPLFTTLVSFTNNLSNELPVILFTKYFGVNVAGVYGLSLKVSKAPVGLVQGSISSVFFNKISKAFNEKKNIESIVKATYKKMFYLALTIFTVLFCSSYFLEFFLGVKWSDSGTYVRIIIPVLFLGFINAPVTSLITVLNKQKEFVLFDTLLLAFRFLAIFISYKVYNDIIVTLAFFVGVGVVFNLLIMFYFLNISKKNKIENMKIYN